MDLNIPREDLRSYGDGVLGLADRLSQGNFDAVFLMMRGGYPQYKVARYLFRGEDGFPTDEKVFHIPSSYSIYKENRADILRTVTRRILEEYRPKKVAIIDEASTGTSVATALDIMLPVFEGFGTDVKALVLKEEPRNGSYSRSNYMKYVNSGIVEPIDVSKVLTLDSFINPIYSEDRAVLESTRNQTLETVKGLESGKVGNTFERFPSFNKERVKDFVDFREAVLES